MGLKFTSTFSLINDYKYSRPNKLQKPRIELKDKSYYIIKYKVDKKPDIEYFTAFSLVHTRNTVTKIQYCKYKVGSM